MLIRYSSLLYALAAIDTACPSRIAVSVTLGMSVDFSSGKAAMAAEEWGVEAVGLLGIL